MSIKVDSYHEWRQSEIERYTGDKANQILNTNRRRYNEHVNRQLLNLEAFERMQREIEDVIYKRTHHVRNSPLKVNMSEAQVKASLSELWRDE